jgi:hypothetical protein
MLRVEHSKKYFIVGIDFVGLVYYTFNIKRETP